MKFIINSASNQFDLSKLKRITTEEVKCYNHDQSVSWTEEISFIELDSMEELVSLIQDLKEDCVCNSIIIDYDILKKDYKITIYDDYIE